MRSALNLAAARTRAGRARSASASLSTVPPDEESEDYIPELASIAATILYRSPRPSREGRPVYILNAAAFPDALEVDYDSLLSYVLARLPGEDELLSGTEYEIIFFAGGQPEGVTSEKKAGPGMGWYLQAYHVLSRATRKKLQRLYIVHPRTWVRVLVGVFGTVVSPKFRRKIVHVNTLSQLAIEQPIYRLLIPPSTYLHDRKLEPEVEVPYASGRRAFNALHPLPENVSTGQTRLPRVLRETTSFILNPVCIQQEGLFRIPPHNVLSGVLKEAYDRGQMWIVWKERGATFVQPGLDQALIDEVRLEDAYGVHLAASLIKTWYRELREPIFPESSYAYVREKYGDPDTEITPEDLVDLLLPASPTSPLSASGREILNRHLLPLLSEVAAHEPQNKMNAENLAICFSMCLVCGSNQLEDAKVSTVVRRVLSAAIQAWPVLKEGMGVDAVALEDDLKPPADPRDYEDPVDEEAMRPRSSQSGTSEGKEGHRIVMFDSGDEAEAKPPLPERNRPALPPRPLPQVARSRATSETKKLPGLDVSSPVKRKPVSNATSAESSPSTATHHVDRDSLPLPPRYSTVFHPDGASIHRAESPASYTSTPVDGFGPGQARQEQQPPYQPGIPQVQLGQSGGGTTYPIDQKKTSAQGLPLFEGSESPYPALHVPKRKALSAEHKRSESDESARGDGKAYSHSGVKGVMGGLAGTNETGVGTSRSASDGSKLARLAAEKAAGALAERMGGLPKAGGVEADVAQTSSHSQQQRQEDGLATIAIPSLDGERSDNGPGVFRKPSWPASANASHSQRPPLPTRPSHTVPKASPSTLPQNHLAAPPLFPKPRTPSPGLLKRMETMEAGLAAKDADVRGRGRVNLKKQSVDDLRRLYEDRASTVEGLRRAEEARRKSSPAVGV